MKPTDEQSEKRNERERQIDQLKYELIDQYMEGELSGEVLNIIKALIANDSEFAKAVQDKQSERRNEREYELKYELIDQYLQGELSGEKLSTIEALIANDPEFAKAVQTERILIAAIQQVAREKMKEKLNKIPIPLKQSEERNERAYELIDQYLQGELSGEELTTIEALIANDPEFAEAVQTERILIAAIQQVAREEMKEKLNKIPFAATKTNPYKPLLWILAAASVLLFSGLGISLLFVKSYAPLPQAPPLQKEMAFNLRIKTIGIKDTSLGYIVNNKKEIESVMLPIRLIMDHNHFLDYRLTDTLILQSRFAIVNTTLELIRLTEKDVSQLYLKIGNRFYPLSKTEELVRLKPEMDERVLALLAETQPNGGSAALLEPSDEVIVSQNKYSIKDVNSAPPENAKSDAPPPEKVVLTASEINNLKKSIKKELEELAVTKKFSHFDKFENTDDRFCVTGTFLDDDRESYSIYEYTIRLRQESYRIDIQDIELNDAGKITRMKVRELFVNNK
ncbi:hypothetical protein C7N43_37785 [Sphingobacteriales bacterium UPWRP_1]|nr:hypothetical protein C7N43_37785 [Sphingobacteriales bacterium UPWRP_1]